MSAVVNRTNKTAETARNAGGMTPAKINTSNISATRTTESSQHALIVGSR